MDCKICEGQCGLLGVLGRRAHYQCRDCGAQFSALVENDVDDNEEEEDGDE